MLREIAFALEALTSDRTLVLVLEEQLAQQQADPVKRSTAQVGVVVRRRELERKGWELAYHVLTRPRADGTGSENRDVHSYRRSGPLSSRHPPVCGGTPPWSAHQRS